MLTASTLAVGALAQVGEAAAAEIVRPTSTKAGTIVTGQCQGSLKTTDGGDVLGTLTHSALIVTDKPAAPAVEKSLADSNLPKLKGFDIPDCAVKWNFVDGVQEVNYRGPWRYRLLPPAHRRIGKVYYVLVTETLDGATGKVTRTGVKIFAVKTATRKKKVRR